MHSNILVAFLEAVELPDVVEVVSPDDDRVLHLFRDAHALQNPTTNADVGACEGALLVDVAALEGPLLRSEH